MKYLIAFLCIILIALTSCEGRKTKHQSLTENIEDFKKHKSIENVTYVPETYHETVIDTLMANGFTANIKTFTDMESFIPIEIKKDTITEKKYYREVKSEISVEFNNIQVFDALIDRGFVLSHFDNFENTKFNSNLQGVWVNQNDFSNSNDLSLDIYYGTINSEEHIVFNMIVKSDGSFKITQKKEDQFL